MKPIKRQSKYLYDSTGDNVLLPKVIIQDLMYPKEPSSFDPDNDASVSKGAEAVASCLEGQVLKAAGLNLKTNGGKVEAILTNDGLSLINNDASGNITLKTTNVKIGEGVSGNLNVEGQMTGKLLTVTGDNTNPSTINGKLVVVSDTSSSSKETGALVISKKTTTGKPGLGVEGNINSGGDINVAGKVKGNKLEATTSLTVDGTSTLTGNVTASSNITATSTSSGKGVITATNIVSNKRLTVGAEGVSVTGDSTFNNKVAVGGQLTGYGNATISGQLSIGGNITTDSKWGMILVPNPDKNKIVYIGNYDNYNANKPAELDVLGSAVIADTLKVGGVYAGCPIGTIVMWPNVTAPEHWLLCDGTAYKKTDYPSLYNIVGNTYAYSPMSSDYFRVPNFSGAFPIGPGHQPDGIMNGDNAYSKHNLNFNLGCNNENVGEYIHKLTSVESGLPDHSHEVDCARKNYLPGNRIYAESTGTFADTWSSTSEGSGNKDASNAHNNMPPYSCVNFIIKYE